MLLIEKLVLCFNSLQTGKCIQSCRRNAWQGWGLAFVSIPFKRESVFRDAWQGWGLAFQCKRFNSLQTGKCIQRAWKSAFTKADDEAFQFPSNGKVYSEKQKIYLSAHRRHLCFNSLQTGKCIQSGTGGPVQELYDNVSIPFKRESVFRVAPRRHNGGSRESKVSIPFKRESVFRVFSNPVHRVKRLLFQFPSNGKVYSERHKQICRICRRGYVSIPFKRESVFRDRDGHSRKRLGEIVSIPFKRESVFRVFSADAATRPVIVANRFNSLQTGKCIQRRQPRFFAVCSTRLCCFNSLQTGKCIQRSSIMSSGNAAPTGFNSLQTGKCIQSSFH